MTKREWVLKRNCSLSPRQLGLSYSVLCGMSLTVAVLFATLHGAWLVLAYSVLEMGVAALAFLVYARHATDRECILLADGCLLVDRVQAGRTERTKLDPCWTHVAVPRCASGLINLEARGVRIEVGRFVTEATRRQVACELRQALGCAYGA